MFKTPQLTKPVQAYDPTVSVEDNMAGKGAPSAQNIVAAQKTPQAQLQRAQAQQAAPATQPVPRQTIDPQSATAGMEALLPQYTTPEEEERLRRSSMARRRIMAVGDALRHIGNIYHTINYAPSQQFNSPVQEEEQRYLRDKALRDKDNRFILSYQQQKAIQDAKQRQWEADYGLKQANYASQEAYRKLQGDIAAANAASQDAYRRGNLARQEAADKARNDYNERKLKQQTAHQNRMAGIASINARNNTRRTDAYVNRMKSGGSGSSGVAPLDTPKGQITPSGKNYNNQLQQIWNYAESKGLVNQSDVQRALAQAGLGNETPESVKRQQVMSLLRTNQALADYAQQRLGWKYGASNPSTDWDEYAEDDEVNWDNYAD